MRFREALQVRLQERYRRLYKSDWTTFEQSVRYTLDWISEVPALKAITDSIGRSHPDVDVSEWWSTVNTRHAIPNLPSEAARAKVVLYGLHEIAYTEGVDFRQLLHPLTREGNYDASIRTFCSQWVEPVVELLQERLSAESDILYLLERYRRGVNWFDREALYKQYESDTTRGEAVYDTDLRRFLFEQGVDFPFSQPEGPSGKADVVAQVDDDHPLALEVKLYDGDRYSVSYLAKGVGQALRYAEDYDRTDAYLVVFNLATHKLDFPTDDPEAGWPPRLEVAGVTLFLVEVQAVPLPSASRSGKSKTKKVTRGALLHELD